MDEHGADGSSADLVAGQKLALGEGDGDLVTENKLYEAEDQAAAQVSHPHKA